MKRGWLFWTIVANLLVMIDLAFAWPHLMISPGPLVAAHADMATNCFSCHTALQGTTAQKCTTCHALTDIGLRTTKGAQLPQRGIKTSFHQQLAQQECMACHTDHAGPKLAQQSRKQFSHALLKPEVQKECATCHTKPDNDTHRTVTASCSQCHSSKAWKPATFEHTALAPAVLARCESCHKPPTNKLHAQIQGNCGQCHTQTAWKPATFDHSRFFVLDKDHNASCITCHLSNDYTRYTCYGCHEHTVANVLRKHEKEGISNFGNCVGCHRNANGEGESGEREGGKGREGRKRD